MCFCLCCYEPHVFSMYCGTVLKKSTSWMTPVHSQVTYINTALALKPCEQKLFGHFDNRQKSGFSVSFFHVCTFTRFSTNLLCSTEKRAWCCNMRFAYLLTDGCYEQGKWCLQFLHFTRSLIVSRCTVWNGLAAPVIQPLFYHFFHYRCSFQLIAVFFPWYFKTIQKPPKKLYNIFFCFVTC